MIRAPIDNPPVGVIIKVRLYVALWVQRPEFLVPLPPIPQESLAHVVMASAMRPLMLHDPSRRVALYVYITGKQPEVYDRASD
jgi:hypothetical protein